MASGYRYPGGLTDADFADGSTSTGYQPHNFCYGSKINVNTAGTITLLGVRANQTAGTNTLKISVFDSSGNLLGSNGTITNSSGSKVWVDSETLSISVSAGDHYVFVSSSDTNTEYGYSTTSNGCGEAVAYASFPPSSLSVTEDETGTRFGVRLWLEEPAAGSTTANAEGSGTLAATIGNIGTPLIEAADATVTTVGTATSPWAINFPAAVSGDLLVAIIAWDDSTTVASVTAPTGPNSEAANSIVGPVASASTEMRMQAWWWKATGSWSATTRNFTPAASETCRAVVFKVPTGEFDATTAIGASSSSASAGTAETNINSPAFSAGSTDGGGRLVLCFGSDVDAITAPASGTSTVNNATGGGVGLCVVTRDSPVTNSESIASITATIAGDSWAALGFVVRRPEQAATGETVAAISGTGTLAATTSFYKISQTAAAAAGTGTLSAATSFYQISETTAALAGSGALNATLSTANQIDTTAALAGTSDLQATTSFYQIVDTVATINGVATLNAATTFFQISETVAALTGTGTLAAVTSSWVRVDTVASLTGSGILSATIQDNASNVRNTVATISGSSTLNAAAYAIANTTYGIEGVGTLDGVTDATPVTVETPAKRLGGTRKRGSRYESIDAFMRRYMQEEKPVQIPPTKKVKAPVMYHRLEDSGFTRFELSQPEWVSFWQVIPAPKPETVEQAYTTIERKRRQLEQDDEEWLMLM